MHATQEFVPPMPMLPKDAAASLTSHYGDDDEILEVEINVGNNLAVVNNYTCALN
jgi:hypothetical protein